MKGQSPIHAARHLQRYREISGIFARYGFSQPADQLELQTRLGLPRRRLRRER